LNQKRMSIRAIATSIAMPTAKRVIWRSAHGSMLPPAAE
jgi:hypothetical protein